MRDFSLRGNGSGARSRNALAILSLAVLAIAVSAGPALAAPPIVTLGSATPAYINADVTGPIDPGENEPRSPLESTTDPVVEGWNSGPPFDPPTFLPANAGPTEVTENIHE